MDAEGAGRLSGAPEQVAPQLLGARLRLGPVVVRLTEVEAYGADDDPGSHAHRGRTPRTAVMFGPPGRLYVYLVYGMHHCANVVVGPDGTAGAVLLRAGEVVEGRSVAQERRGPAVAERDLARGPARLCVALGLDLTHDGADLLGREGPALELGPGPGGQVRRGPRVGLRQAPERPWRFWLHGEASVSTYRPAAPRPARRPAR